MNDAGFWWEFVGKTGAPIFAATLVAALLSDEFELQHGILADVAMGMMAHDSVFEDAVARAERIGAGVYIGGIDVR